MSVSIQIIFGSVILSLCSLIHVAVLVTAIGLLRRLAASVADWTRLQRAGAMLGTGFSAVVLAHTLQVWIWSFALLLVGALPTFENAIYFALVTSTTVGYGDLTLGENFRIFGAFAGVTGLLTFGLSTAILVGLFERLLRPKE